MAFFEPEKLKRRKLSVDVIIAGSQQGQVQQRLDRIEENYQRAELMLADLETKIAADEQLSKREAEVVDVEASSEFETKRKWRGRTADSARAKKSNNRRPKKPR